MALAFAGAGREIGAGELFVPRPTLAIAILAMLFGVAAPARAEIIITVDKSTQRLTATVDGFTRFEFPVSTGRTGYRTPNGSYRPERLAVKWFSRTYDWSPMPHSIFFHGGYAIHGSYEISRLGSPASHGCIRLHPDNAAALFALVQANVKDTRIVIRGDAPAAQRRDNSGRRTRPRAPSPEPPPNTFESIFLTPGRNR